jgi:CelD/BcsL family acetyltransferase involved in cellulose biosynthesis
MRVELTDDPTVFRRHDWSGVVESDSHGTLFHTPAYLKLWWEEFGSGSLVVALGFEGPDVVAACGLEEVDGTLAFLGGFEVTDYMGPVALPGREDRFAKELTAALADRGGWDLSDLRGLPDASPWPGLLAAAAGANGLSTGPGTEDVAPFVVLPSTYLEYLDGLPSKLRHEIRRKDRRFREEAGEHRIAFASPKSLGADMDLFLEMHRSSPGPKGRFMDAGMEIFFRRLGEAFLPSRAFHLAFLEAHDERVAGAIGFGHRETFFLYNSAFDRRLEHLAPGMVLLAELIRLAIESGRTGFDLLKGNLAYKYRFGAEPRPLRGLTLRR